MPSGTGLTFDFEDADAGGVAVFMVKGHGRPRHCGRSVHSFNERVSSARTTEVRLFEAVKLAAQDAKKPDSNRSGLRGSSRDSRSKFSYLQPADFGGRPCTPSKTGLMSATGLTSTVSPSGRPGHFFAMAVASSRSATFRKK